MSKIVRKHYPVELLPSDLNEGLPIGARAKVVITIESNELPGRGVKRFVGRGRNVHGSEMEVLDYLRSQRDDR